MRFSRITPTERHCEIGRRVSGHAREWRARSAGSPSGVDAAGRTPARAGKAAFIVAGDPQRQRACRRPDGRAGRRQIAIDQGVQTVAGPVSLCGQGNALCARIQSLALVPTGGIARVGFRMFARGFGGRKIRQTRGLCRGAICRRSGGDGAALCEDPRSRSAFSLSRARSHVAAAAGNPVGHTAGSPESPGGRWPLFVGRRGSAMGRPINAGVARFIRCAGAPDAGIDDPDIAARLSGALGCRSGGVDTFASAGCVGNIGLGRWRRAGFAAACGAAHCRTCRRHSPVCRGTGQRSRSRRAAYDSADLAGPALVASRQSWAGQGGGPVSGDGGARISVCVVAAYHALRRRFVATACRSTARGRGVVRRSARGLPFSTRADSRCRLRVANA